LWKAEIETRVAKLLLAVKYAAPSNFAMLRLRNHFNFVGATFRSRAFTFADAFFSFAVIPSSEGSTFRLLPETLTLFHPAR
jgi:hypothetical protein